MTSAAAAQHRVVVLVLPELNLLDLAGPVQVFDAAGLAGAGYRVEFTGLGTAERSAQGPTIGGLTPLAGLAPVGPGDVVLVPGPRLGPAVDGRPLVDPAVVGWVRAAYAGGAHVAAVCSGAIALGEAGLLDGRRCTTHWGLLDALRERYPAARVSAAVLFVHDGRISTSAGISAGIDLALSLVERRSGPAVAAAVARELVLFVRRSGGQEQLSPFLRYRDHLDPLVHRLQDHLAGHLGERLTLDDLAAVAGVSPRSVSRAFTQATGCTPLRYADELRVGAVTTLLAEPDLSIEEIAGRCGYADARHLRRTIRRRFGVAASELRRELAAAR